VSGDDHDGTQLDLDAIEARAVWAPRKSAEDVPELVAEVRRLRVELDRLRVEREQVRAIGTAPTYTPPGEEFLPGVLYLEPDGTVASRPPNETR
jgi:hypothetical protein